MSDMKFHSVGGFVSEMGVLELGALSPCNGPFYF